MRLALEVWGSDYGRIVETAMAAEALGFDAFYYGESPHGLNLETWSVLAGLAERTSTIRLGPVITNFLPTFRSFPLFLRQAHALAVMSGGRLDVRTGAGAAAAWAKPWWGPAGVAYPPYGERLRTVDEWLRAFHREWPGIAAPSVARPPVTVAAVGPRSMLVAARWADVWESSYLTPPELQALAARFGAVCDRPVVRSVEVDAVTAPTEAERSRLEEAFLDERGSEGTTALDKALCGPPEQVAGQLAAYARAGAGQLLVACVEPFNTGTLETLAAARRLPHSG